ncbi:FxsA family protein [Mycolicibacterium sp. P1-5]|uniref:FxsA family protein n=1 Tax=Mycolicibacterium sp. P1-5 TaxID=2024617 RepID=UPI0011EE07AF|nr:FxsA family protein [Mycolicibacterium sp. P1-5]KAA0112335.1 FxsA family protein [Mycolicibacterium sp. P1-5]
MRTFLIYAVVELAVLAALTWSVGIGWTLLILLASSVIGVALAGSQVKRQILKLQRARSDPQGAVADSLLLALGTVLMFIPGIVSTAIGALMLLPPTRSVVRPLAGMLITRGIARRVSVINLTAPGRGDYIEGEVVEEQGGHVSGPVHDVNIVRRY